MWEELKDLKRQVPLLEYLRRHNWTPSSAGASEVAKPRNRTVPSSSPSRERNKESLAKREVIARFQSSSCLRKHGLL
jgi:hypothetical protein